MEFEKIFLLNININKIVLHKVNKYLVYHRDNHEIDQYAYGHL